MKKIIFKSVVVLLTSLMFLSSTFALPRTTNFNTGMARALLYPVLKASDIINSNSPNIMLSDRAKTLGIDLADAQNYLELDATSSTFINCYNNNYDLKIGIALYSRSSPPVQKTVIIPNASLEELAIRTNDHNDTVIVRVNWGVEKIRINLCGGRDYLDGINSEISMRIIADNVVDALPDYITTSGNDDVVEIITRHQEGSYGGFRGYINTNDGDDRITALHLTDGAVIQGGDGEDTVITEHSLFSFHDVNIDAETTDRP